MSARSFALARPLRVTAIRTRFGRSPSLTVGVVILGTIALMCAFVPLLSPYGTDELAGTPFQAPSSSHWFGTDAVGRDVFVRTFAAGVVDLMSAVVAVGGGLLIGTTIGTLAGFAKRRAVDTVLMRTIDAVIAFPFLILVLVLVFVIGADRSMGPLPAGLPATLIAVLAVGWAYYARLARTQTLALRGQDYVTAATVLGYSRRRIAFRHLMPSVVRVNVAYAVGDAIAIVVWIASLAFLGAGVQPPTPEWGSIMYEGRIHLATAWWITVFPGVVLVITGLGLSLVADALLAPEQHR